MDKRLQILSSRLPKYPNQLLSKIQLLKATQCLKITQIVAFNFASEASYIYILNGQKSMIHFDEVLKT